jgi:hypothetical protein
LADDKDVIGKADALLRRHSIAAPGSATDTGGVPVLTDLVPDPAALSEADAAIAREVAEQVRQEMESRLASEVERLRTEMAASVDAAIAKALASRPPK